MTPQVSVIVPTHDRLPYLRQCLAALAAQTVDAGDVEVIVVADGCQDGTVDALAAEAAAGRVRVVSQPASGASAARNRGAAEARGRLLVFIDDDVVASPGVLAAHLRAHADAGNRVAVGPCRLAPPAPHDYYGAILHAWWEATYDALLHPQARPDYRHVLSGNLSMTAATFARVGGFDPSLRCFEDPELGIRLLRDGAVLVGLADAEARHLETTDVARSFRRARDEGEADVRLAALHPQVRPTLRLARVGRISWALVHDARRIGATLAAIAGIALGAARRLRLRRLYGFVYGGLRHYWYCRGVAETVGDRARLTALTT